MKKLLFLVLYFCLSAYGSHGESIIDSTSESIIYNVDNSIKDTINRDKDSYFGIPVSFTSGGFEIFPNNIKAVNEPINIFDMAARQLAGLYIPDNLRNKQAWIDYAKVVNEEWEKLFDSSLSKIKDWSDKNIAPFIEDANVVFYPFGGPDIAYATQFFPSARDYILVGLEPIGSFDNVNKNIRSETAVTSLKKASSSYLQKGYFITSEMMTQLANKEVRGVLCLLLLELSKLGYTVNSIEEISINSEGLEVERSKGMLDGIKITCKKTSGITQRKVYYIRADLSNMNGKLFNLFNFMKRSQFITFLKSASYALHDATFSNIRNFILNNTNSLLQDDTGVPFHCFDSKWEKCAFGKYTEPTLPIFKAYKQQSLANYYVTNQVADIPFKIGYGFNQGHPNLLFAIPKARRVAQQMNIIKAAGSRGGCPCKNNNIPNKK